MKEILRNYIMLYNSVQFSEKNGWHLAFRWDRILHGGTGDIIMALIFATIGTWNNWGANEQFNSDTMWWFYYVLIPLFSMFVIGIVKEYYDTHKKTPTGFDWGDVWAGVIPFLFVYLPVMLILSLTVNKTLLEIEKEEVDSYMELKK